jgi:hypothetical protein
MIKKIKSRSYKAPLLSILILVGMATGCKDEELVEEVLVSVADVSPKEAMRGDTVTITGANFGVDLNALAVTINYVPASLISVNDNEVKAIIPLQATTGVLSIGKTTSPLVVALPVFRIAETNEPFIVEVIPQSGAQPGDIVTIKGGNFNLFGYKNYVTIGGEFAEVIDAIETELKVLVPGIDKSGKVLVSVYGKQSNAVDIGISPVSPVADGRIFFITYTNDPLLEFAPSATIYKGKNTTQEEPSGELVYTDPGVEFSFSDTNDALGTANNLEYFTFNYHAPAKKIVYGALLASENRYAIVSMDPGNPIRNEVYSSTTSPLLRQEFLIDQITGELFFLGRVRILGVNRTTIVKGSIDGAPALAFGAPDYSSSISFSIRLLALSKDRIFFRPFQFSNLNLQTSEVQSIAKDGTDFRAHGIFSSSTTWDCHARQSDNKLYYLSGNRGGQVREFDFDTNQDKALYSTSLLEPLIDVIPDGNKGEIAKILSFKVAGNNLYFVSGANSQQVWRVKTDGSSFRPTLVYSNTNGNTPFFVGTRTLAISPLE